MLCKTCSEIDIAAYFTRETHVHRDKLGFIQPTSSAINLGGLQEIYSRSIKCDFCHLIFNAVTHQGPWREWHTPERFLELSEMWNFRAQCLSYSYVYASDKNTSRGEDHSKIEKGMRMAIRLQPKPGQSKDYPHHAGEIQLATPESFSGRVMNPHRVDVGLAKRWLTICDSQHGPTCEVPALDPETVIPDNYPENPLVIDVQEMKLQKILKGARYLALSYCWPTDVAGTFQTTKAVYEELLQPGSLEERTQDLSSIVQDAISFVREFGERYLWVDALCIIQDDYEYKQDQIRQMDLVYSAAIFTIICAHPQPLNETYLGLDGF